MDNPSKGSATDLCLSDLSWVPEKWWKLITGDQQCEAPTRLNRRQTARNIADISAWQIFFVDQRQASTEKLEAVICDIIKAYNQFQLPRYWGDPKRAAADGTQWNLYENSCRSVTFGTEVMAI